MTTYVTAGNPQPIAHPCPNCKSTLTSRISDFERCSQCGHQFNQRDIATAPALARQKAAAPTRMEHVQELGIIIEKQALADAQERRDAEGERPMGVGTPHILADRKPHPS
jgi:ribosomal protein L37AE/L43A